jgi:branched-chain amino acid transport system permease protein
MTDTFIQALVSGLLIGGVFAIISVGLALAFGVMDIVNFAQADFLMVGMYISYVLFSVLGLDPLLGTPLVMAIMFAFGAVTQRFLIKPILKAPMVNQIFLTIGISLVLVGGSQVLFGADFRSVKTAYQTEAVVFGPIRMSLPYLYAFAMSAVLAGGLWLFLEKTDLGRMMRATAQNSTAAQLVGINPQRIHLIAFAVGTALTGAAGAAILPYAYVYPTIGHNYGLIMFTVVTLGGLGSVGGAVAGGLMIGVVYSLGSALLPTVLQNGLVYVIFIGTLMFRPYGLFKR